MIPLFDSITISCEVMAEKPTARIFQAGLRAASVRPDEALHVGDGYEEDICGAQGVGMRAILVGKGGALPSGCDSVKSLLEIAAKLE